MTIERIGAARTGAGGQNLPFSPQPALATLFLSRAKWQ